MNNVPIHPVWCAHDQHCSLVHVSRPHSIPPDLDSQTTTVVHMSQVDRRPAVVTIAARTLDSRQAIDLSLHQAAQLADILAALREGGQ